MWRVGEVSLFLFPFLRSYKLNKFKFWVLFTGKKATGNAKTCAETNFEFLPIFYLLLVYVGHQILTKIRQFKMHISFCGIGATPTIKANFYDSRQVETALNLSHIRAYKLCFNLYAERRLCDAHRLTPHCPPLSLSVPLIIILSILKLPCFAKECHKRIFRIIKAERESSVWARGSLWNADKEQS